MSISIELSKFDQGTLRLLCAEKIVSCMSALFLGQGEDADAISDQLLGEALHGVQLLIADGRALLEGGSDEVAK